MVQVRPELMGGYLTQYKTNQEPIPVAASTAWNCIQAMLATIQELWAKMGFSIVDNMLSGAEVDFS